jgi:hypothetical protein
MDTDSALLKPAQKDGKWGYVDSAGKFVVSPQFDSAEPFSEGLAAVQLHKRFGYIGPDGRFVIQPKYSAAKPFKGDLALVATRQPLEPLGSEYGEFRLAQITYVDRSGREIRAPLSVRRAASFSDGLAAVVPDSVLRLRGGCAKGGYLNVRGEWAIEPQFDDLRDFSEGLAAVNSGARCGIGGKWGYVGKDGKVVVPFQYKFAGEFKSGHACVAQAEQWKLIDAKGNGTSIGKDECLR